MCYYDSCYTYAALPVAANLIYDSKFVLMTLFQLKISLNREGQYLKIGTGWDRRDDVLTWGVCRSGIKGISAKLMRLAYMEKIRMSKNLTTSVFESNVFQALGFCLANVSYVQCYPLSLTGYSFDFEILLDFNGNPIRIPNMWKNQTHDNLRASIGGNRDTTVGNHLESKQSINIASDWGSKFGSYPCRVSRKIVIEANGPFHYTRNCYHCMGYSRLKERHLRSLGWELIIVSGSG